MGLTNSIAYHYDGHTIPELDNFMGDQGPATEASPPSAVSDEILVLVTGYGVSSSQVLDQRMWELTISHSTTIL